MSFFTDAFHKITKKTHSPRIVWRSSYVVVDSKTGAPKLQGQCIQPQVGMYSVLTIGEHVDIVVRYARTLPYTLPGSEDDEDLPQVTYVVPRQDMKAGDFFTLFVGREHFMVEVIQVLPKSSHSSDSFLDSSSKTDTSRARWQPVQPSLDHSPEPLPPSTGDRQDVDIPIITPKSPQQTPTPVTRPLPACPDHPEVERVFSTKTGVDGEIVPNLTRTNAAVGPVAAVANDHPDRERSTFVKKTDSFPQESSVRPSDQIHQTKPSDKPVIPLQVDVNMTRTPKGARPRSPSTSANRQPPRGRDSPLPPTPHCAILKTTRENLKPRVQKKSTIGHNTIQVPKETAGTSNNQLQIPLPIQSTFAQVERPLQEYAMKKAHGAYREPSKFDPPLRELSNIGRGFETVTMEDSVRSTHASVYSFLSDATKPKPSVSRKSPQRTKTQGPLAEHSESESDVGIQPAVPASVDEYYDIYYLVPKRIQVPRHKVDRVYASTLPKRGLHT